MPQYQRILLLWRTKIRAICGDAWLWCAGGWVGVLRGGGRAGGVQKKSKPCAYRRYVGIFHVSLEFRSMRVPSPLTLFRPAPYIYNLQLAPKIRHKPLNPSVYRNQQPVDYNQVVHS